MKEIEKLKFYNQLAIKIYAIGTLVPFILILFDVNFFIMASIWIVSIATTLLIRSFLKCPFCGHSVLRKKEKQFGMADWHLHIPPKCPNCYEELK